MNKEGLEKTILGSTGLKVTKICAGGATVGGMPYAGYSVPEREGIDTLLHIFQSPINFLDTASLYEASELRIGKAIRAYGGLPEGFVIATKADRDLDTGDFSSKQVLRSVEKSRNLLGMDFLPIVYLHDPEFSNFTFEQIMAENGPVAKLHQLKQEGIIGHIGISGGPVDMMLGYINTGAFEVAITHNRYTLINRSAEPLIDTAVSRGVAVVNAAVYGGGILAKGFKHFSTYAYQEASPKIIKRIKELELICSKNGVSLAAVALQYSLRNTRIASTVIGMSNQKEVDQTLDFARAEMPENLWQDIQNSLFDMSFPINAVYAPA